MASTLLADDLNGVRLGPTHHSQHNEHTPVPYLQLERHHKAPRQLKSPTNETKEKESPNPEHKGGSATRFAKRPWAQGYTAATLER